MVNFRVFLWFVGFNATASKSLGLKEKKIDFPIYVKYAVQSWKTSWKKKKKYLWKAKENVEGRAIHFKLFFSPAAAEEQNFL